MSSSTKEGLGCLGLVLYTVVGVPMWFWMVENGYDKYVYYTIGGAIALIVSIGIFVALYLHVKEKWHEKKVNEYFTEIQQNFPNALESKAQGICRNYATGRYRGDKHVNIYNWEYKERVYNTSKEEWAIEEEKEIQRIEERKRIQTLCNEIKSKYPDGYKYWIAEHGDYGNNIITHEADIRIYQDAFSEGEKTIEWLRHQEEFSKKVRNLEVVIHPFGYYTYLYDLTYRHLSVRETKQDIKRKTQCIIEDTDGKFKIWQFFKWAYSQDTELDYTLCPQYKENYEIAQKLLSLDSDTKLNGIWYKQVEELVKNIGEDAIVIFGSSGLSEELGENDDLFSPAESLNFAPMSVFAEKLKESKIRHIECWDSYDELNKLCTNEYTPIVIVEMVSSHAQTKALVERITKTFAQKYPLLVYISLLKEFSKEEMIPILDKAKKEKEERNRIEKEKKLNTHTLEKKKDSQEIIQILDENQIDYFWHFTDRQNIESIIKEGGLFSWNYCQSNDIAISNPGGDALSRNLDVKNNLQDYVRLSFCSDHPMAYRKEEEGADIVYLKVSRDVALFESTMFSDINATDNSHHHGKCIEDLKRVNFAAVKKTYVSRDDEEFKSHQAEVMVKTFIPIRYILNIDDFLQI